LGLRVGGRKILASLPYSAPWLDYTSTWPYPVVILATSNEFFLEERTLRKIEKNFNDNYSLTLELP
jgi:hypothetical protein